MGCGVVIRVRVDLPVQEWGLSSSNPLSLSSLEYLSTLGVGEEAGGGEGGTLCHVLCTSLFHLVFYIFVRSFYLSGKVCEEK